MTLGDELKRSRESARISIQDLAAATSIRIGLLEEMEANNFEHCGGDTYARGHIRTISSKLGIDSEALLDLYEEEHASVKRNIQDLLAENSVTKVPMEKKRLSWKVPASISMIVVIVIAIVQIIVSNTQGSSPVAAPTPTPSESASVETSPSASTAPVADGTVTITVTATRGSSLADFVVDGEHLYKGPLIQGDTKTFSNAQSISVYFSNPGGLDVTVNGQLITDLGGENQEVRRTFRAN